MDVRFINHFKFGVITQNDGDTGDSSQRCGTYITLKCIVDEDVKEEWSMFKKQLMVLSGRFRRSPVKESCWSRPSNLSRDQLSILKLGMAAIGDIFILNQTMKEQLKRLTFHQNFLHGNEIEYWKMPDIMNPHEISVWVRGNKIWWLYPLLLILDLGFFADLMFRKHTPWDYDNMLAQNLMFAVKYMPTFISKVAFKLYQKTDFLKRLHIYHVEFHNGCPPMYDLFVEANNYLLRKI